MVRKTKPDDTRVDGLYQKLVNNDAFRDVSTGAARHQVQQIVYIEDACRSILDAIKALEDAPDPASGDAAMYELKSGFRVLRI